METGTAAALLAAGLAFLGIVWQQARHWREVRRDRVREAYSKWMSALARARRTEERLLSLVVEANAVRDRLRAAGDPMAQQGLLPLTEAQVLQRRSIENELESSNWDLDITFGEICLLDGDWRRIKAAEAVQEMDTLDPNDPGDAQASFNQRWDEKSRALGHLSSRINRTLALEGLPSILWEFVERRTNKRLEKLHARMAATDSGGSKAPQ